MFLTLGFQDQPCQRPPKNVGAEDEGDGAVGVLHDRQVLIRREHQERQEAVRQEEEVVHLSADVGGPPGDRVSLQQRLQPGALVNHQKEILLEVHDDELVDERDVVAAVVAVPDRQEDEGS